VTRSLTVLFAIACGATVANNYWAQPLLDTIASQFGVGTTAAGLVVTASQIGYAAGLVLIVPLGDVLARRRLIVVLLLACAVALAAAAAAPSLLWLGVAAGVASLTSVVAQILVPLAASLAAEEERGRVIGTVMSGLLMGILLARTVAGLVAEVAGWRTVYAGAAAAMVVLAAVVGRRLPRLPPGPHVPYGELLRSVGRLMGDEPVLRRRSAYGALTFGAFAALWTTLAFLLSSDPYNFSEAVIGLFSLAGVAGALAARRAGRLHDRGAGAIATGACLVLGALAFAAIALGRDHLVALLAGIVVMDMAVQGTQILNQSAVYALAPDARSRLTTAYMTSYFAGGALGSAGGAAAYAQWGWTGTSVVGAGLFLAALALWALAEPRRPAALGAAKQRRRLSRAS
jgi:predicted MFS family arabinose efflux permease